MLGDEALWLLVIAFAAVIEAVAAGLISNWVERRWQMREDALGREREERDDKRIREMEEREAQREREREEREQQRVLAAEQRKLERKAAKAAEEEADRLSEIEASLKKRLKKNHAASVKHIDDQVTGLKEFLLSELDRKGESE